MGRTLIGTAVVAPRFRKLNSDIVLRAYYAEVDPEELSERSIADLYGAALAHLKFARRYSIGAPKIRVYNPVFAEHGWQSTHTVVEIVNDDMPFLVDSVNMELNRLGSGVHLIIHPVVRVRRDESGALLDVLPFDTPAEDAQLESFIHAEVVRETLWAIFTQPLLPLFYLIGRRLAGGGGDRADLLLQRRDTLFQHPAVAECAVIGVPCAERGQKVKAFIVRKPGAAATEAEVVAWCRERMANFKVPREVHVVDALPLNAMGKVTKATLSA